MKTSKKLYFFSLIPLAFISYVLLQESTDSKINNHKNVVPSKNELSAQREAPTQRAPEPISSSTQPEKQMLDNLFKSALPYDQRVELALSRRENPKYSEDELKEALASDSVWELSSSYSETLQLSEEEISDGRIFIDSNPLIFELMTEGDSIDLDIPQLNDRISLNIDNVKVNKSYLQWSGKVDGKEGTFRITRGKRATLGSLYVDGEHIQFEIIDGKGWIHYAHQMHKREVTATDQF